MSVTRVTLVCLITVLVSACTAEQAPSLDYAQRLQNVLNTGVAPKPLAPPRIPSQRALQLATAQSELSMREFLSLRQCKLHTVIAHRNSLIGKVAHASQLLLNDLQILQHTPACIAELGDNAIGLKLADFFQLKQSTLQQSKWNAIMAGPEYQQFWSMAKPASDYPGRVSEDVLQTLEQLHAFSESVINLDTGQNYPSLESLLGRLRKGDGGQLLAAYAKLSTGLHLANQAVRQRLQQPLCLQTKPTPSAQNLRNIVLKYFIPKVQARAVQLQRRSRILLPAVARLEQAYIQQQPQIYVHWRLQRDQLIDQTQALVTEHAKLLQQLFQQCGLQAGMAADQRR